MYLYSTMVNCVSVQSFSILSKALSMVYSLLAVSQTLVTFSMYWLRFSFSKSLRVKLASGCRGNPVKKVFSW
jgi:hypothetical protein